MPSNKELFVEFACLLRDYLQDEGIFLPTEMSSSNDDLFRSETSYWGRDRQQHFNYINSDFTLTINQELSSDFGVRNICKAVEQGGIYANINSGRRIKYPTCYGLNQLCIGLSDDLSNQLLMNSGHEISALFEKKCFMKLDLPDHLDLITESDFLNSLIDLIRLYIASLKRIKSVDSKIELPSTEDIDSISEQFSNHSLQMLAAFCGEELHVRDSHKIMNNRVSFKLHDDFNVLFNRCSISIFRNFPVPRKILNEQWKEAGLIILSRGSSMPWQILCHPINHCCVSEFIESNMRYLAFIRKDLSKSLDLIDLEIKDELDTDQRLLLLR